MKCQNCGTEFSGNFCPTCGAQSQTPTEQPKKKSKTKKIILIVAILLVVGLIGGISANLILSSDLQSAQTYIAEGNYAAAKEVLDKQLSTNGSQSQIYVVYADYYLAQGDYLSALELLDKGINRCSSPTALEEKAETINAEYADEINAALTARAEAEKQAEQQRQDETAQQTQSQETYVVVTAERLLADFEANEVNAEQIYKGKKLKITGTVETVAKDILDNTYVTLSSGQDFGWSVQCYFSDKDEIQKLAALQKGDTITVIGKYDDFLLNVLVKGCVLSN